MPAAYPPPPLPHTQVREECGIVLCLAMEAAAPPPAAHAALGAQLAAEVSDLVAHLRAACRVPDIASMPPPPQRKTKV